jgi:hypothetical protein
MASENIALDENSRWGLAGVTNDSDMFILNARINPINNRLIVEGVVTSSNTSIGSTIPGLTQGSVLFGGAGGTLAQDNANFFWDDSHGFLGIGTNTPSANLDINGTAIITGSIGTPTFVLGRDNSGNISNLTLGTGLSLTGGVLSVTGGSTGYNLFQNVGVSVTARTTVNLTNLLTASDVGAKTQLTINTANLGNDSTFISTLTSNSTFITDVATGLIADTTFLYNLANSTTFVNDLIANTTFTTNLANNANFISTLTANSSFQTDISNIVNNPATNPNAGKVFVSAIDTTLNYLQNKLIAGTNITIIPSGAGNETLTIAASGGGGGDTAIFSYGEPISANDYVFQAGGNEVIPITIPGGSGSGYNITSGSQWIADTFTTDSRLSLVNSVTTSLGRSVFGITLGGTIVAKIYAVSGGVPTGSALYTSATVAGSSINYSGNTFVTFTFSGVSLSGSTTYAIVIDPTNITFGGTAIIATQYTSGTQGATSSNSGSTWTGSQNNFGMSIVQGLAGGYVYRVAPNQIFDNGGDYPSVYIGFATVTGVKGSNNAVQYRGIFTGLSGFNQGRNVYIDLNAPGAVTEGISPTTGRAIGVGVASGAVEMYQMKQRTRAQIFTNGDIVYQDGFLFFNAVANNSSGQLFVTESTPGFSSQILSMSLNTTGGANATAVTVPVRAGFTYTISGLVGLGTIQFLPVING